MRYLSRTHTFAKSACNLSATYLGGVWWGTCSVILQRTFLNDSMSRQCRHRGQVFVNGLMSPPDRLFGRAVGYYVVGFSMAVKVAQPSVDFLQDLRHCVQSTPAELDFRLDTFRH